MQITKSKMKRADGSYLREIEKMDRHVLLISDNFGLVQLNTQNRLDLLGTLYGRQCKKSTIIKSLLPITEWFDVIADQTIDNAILDRLVHNDHRVELK